MPKIEKYVSRNLIKMYLFFKDFEENKNALHLANDNIIIYFIQF